MPATLTQRAIAELFGTFAFVFVGAGAVVASAYISGSASIALLLIALANGIGLAVAVSATMSISGGFLNPAVTIGALVAKKIKAAEALVYILFEVIGAVLAAIIIFLAMPQVSSAAASLGAPSLGAQTSVMQGIMLEAVGTFFLVLVVFGTAIDKKGPRLGGMAIGLTVTVGALAMGPFSGAMFNPARAAGPELVAQSFANWYVWWIGPIVGAILAAVLYKYILKQV